MAKVGRFDGQEFGNEARYALEHTAWMVCWAPIILENRRVVKDPKRSLQVAPEKASNLFSLISITMKLGSGGWWEADQN